MQPERRRTPRIQLLGQLQGRVVTPAADVSVREISLGGMSLESSVPFAVGGVQRFELFLGDGSCVSVSARARHCRPVEGCDPARFVTGFQFVEDAPGADAPAVSNLIGKLG